MGYFGGKQGQGVYQAIIAAMPPHDIFIDAFAGGGAILRHKPPAQRDIALDLDRGAARTLKREFLRADVRCVDAIGFLAGFDYASSRVLVYADPPYVLATRTSRKRYAHDFTDGDHARLIGVLRDIPAAVILSGYPSRLYDELIGDWRTVTFQAATRGGPRTENCG